MCGKVFRNDLRECGDGKSGTKPLVSTVPLMLTRASGKVGKKPKLVSIFFSYQIFLPLISAPTGSLEWGLVTRWAQLLITSNYYQPNTPKDQDEGRAVRGNCKQRLLK